MRPAALLLATAVLAALASLAAPASAQIPQPPQAGVDIRAEAEDLAVSVEGPAQLSLTVENTAEPTGTPLDQDRTIEVSVSGAPAGWTATAQPAVLRLGPGETGTVSLVVTVSTGAEATKADLTVTATMQPMVPDGGAPGVPVEPEATDSVTIQAHRDDSLTRDVLEGVGPWIYVILLAFLVTIIILLRFLFAGRRLTVRLSADTRELTVRAGGAVQFPFRVENLTRRAGNVVFQVSAVESGWRTELPGYEIALEPSGGVDTVLTVFAPDDPGARQGILVSAISVQNPKRPANLDFVAIVKGGKK